MLFHAISAVTVLSVILTVYACAQPRSDLKLYRADSILLTSVEIILQIWTSMSHPVMSLVGIILTNYRSTAQINVYIPRINLSSTVCSSSLEATRSGARVAVKSGFSSELHAP